MRTVIQPQLKFGETDIAAIVLDPKSRDDIPQLLCGLQYIYTDVGLRERVFAILEEVMLERAGAKGKASSHGMEQWKILVFFGGGKLECGLRPHSKVGQSTQNCPTDAGAQRLAR